MRHTRTAVAPSPYRDIRLALLLWVAYFALAVLCDFSCTAHASDRPSLKHTRRMTRITVLRPVRAEGRARAGYPFLQTTANVTRIGVNLSGLVNPIGWFF